MPTYDKFHGIVDKVKKTFGVLRDIFSETPPEPSGRLIVSYHATTIEEPQIPHSLAQGEGAVIVVSPESAPTPDAQEEYLRNILVDFEFVNLPGITNNGNPIRVPVEKIYTPLTLMDQRLGVIHPERDDGFYGGAAALSLSSALQRYRRMLIIGDSGSGKTWLLKVMQLLYAQSLLSEKSSSISSQLMSEQIKFTPINKQRLIIPEKGVLPLLISLRELGNFLDVKTGKAKSDNPEKILDYIRGTLVSHENQHLLDCFGDYLTSGKALIMLDGLDEVGNVRLRQRVVGAIEEFVRRFPDCRYIVTSRPMKYTGAALLAEQFGTLQIRPFNPAEIRKFARAWSLTLESCLAGEQTQEVQNLAEDRVDKLLIFLDEHPSFAELAVNPSILILLAFVQRSRERMPVHPADLADLTIDAILEAFEFVDQPDSGERLTFAQRRQANLEFRRSLEYFAFWLHQQNRNCFSLEEMKAVMVPWLTERIKTREHRAEISFENFQQFVTKEKFLFVENHSAEYSFSQRLFQEFLAARALADREDTLAFTRTLLTDSWWRNVIKLEAGILHGQANYRLGELLQYILDAGVHEKLLPYNTSFLTVECLTGLNVDRLESSFQEDLRKNLKKLINLKSQDGDRQGVINKIVANNAMLRLFGGQSLPRYWKLPFGEPEWVKIPAGQFWMGESGKNEDEAENFLHQVILPEFFISRTLVTNAQYALFVSDTLTDAPEHWHGKQPPRELENHPVSNVNWHEALAYCAWLSEKINRSISLPSEAEWEKAARGDQDQRHFPWGDWAELCANTSELGFGDTTPVGIFSKGASPYGLLDMTGNIREWTRNLADFGYPFDPSDKAREDLSAMDDQARVQRGGSYYFTRAFAGCSQRQRYYPDFRFYNFGFRVVIKPDPA